MEKVHFASGALGGYSTGTSQPTETFVNHGHDHMTFTQRVPKLGDSPILHKYVKLSQSSSRRSCYDLL